MATIDPYHLKTDRIVLDELFADVKERKPLKRHDSGQELSTAEPQAKPRTKKAITQLQDQNDPASADFKPSVFVTWDAEDISGPLSDYIIKPYVKVASKIVRHPTDVVFLTHILMYFAFNLPSAIYLFYNFTWFHGVVHFAYSFWCMGSFTIMLHNHIHNGGVLSKQWAWFDFLFPYVLEPLMGHTWDSYFYHHIKHHHVEGNGPDDLSSTIRYERDNPLHFAQYFGRFFLFVWLELPIYFFRTNRIKTGLQALFSELIAYAFLGSMMYYNARAATFSMLLPFLMLRIGLMVGNWGQHALVDELEPDHDLRSSITLIDVTSNRFCFNDGYHTAHHLNPRRHWREQPVHFLQQKEAYIEGRALVFREIDYLMVTVRLLCKDYMYLASKLIPMGDQIGMTQQELAAMLKTKTRPFTEEMIRQKFPQSSKRKQRTFTLAKLWSALTQALSQDSVH